jgi:hypothetical protein
MKTTKKPLTQSAKGFSMGGGLGDQGGLYTRLGRFKTDSLHQFSYGPVTQLDRAREC